MAIIRDKRCGVAGKTRAARAAGDAGSVAECDAQLAQEVAKREMWGGERVAPPQLRATCGGLVQAAEQGKLLGMVAGAREKAASATKHPARSLCCGASSSMASGSSTSAFLVDGRPRGRAGPGSGLAWLRHLVVCSRSFVHGNCDFFKLVACGVKSCPASKVINSSIHGQDNRTDQNEVRRRTALLPLSAAIVGGARAASVHVNWAHTKMTQEHDTRRARARHEAHAAAASPKAHIARTRE